MDLFLLSVANHIRNNYFHTFSKCILFEKENMNGHAVTRIYFLYAYILMEKLNPQLDLLRTGPRFELVKKNSAETGHNE